MFSEHVISHLEVSSKLCFGGDSSLFEKDGHTSSDLNMTDHNVIDFYDLLIFYKIGNMALIIDSSSIISSTCSF